MQDRQDDSLANTPDLVVRDLVDGDAEGLRSLVAACYAEYEGCLFDRDGYDADLGAYASHLAQRDGRGRVVTHGDRVVACVGVVPAGAPGDAVHGEVKRLYVAADLRGRGIAGALVDWAVDVVVAAGAPAVEAWSDTRFTDAHRLYERKGFRPLLGTRELHDISDSVEHGFVRALRDT